MRPRQNLPEIQRAVKRKSVSLQSRVALRRELGKMARESKEKLDEYRKAEDFAHSHLGAENAGIVMDAVKKAWMDTKGKPPEEFKKRVNVIIGRHSKPAHAKYVRV
jgi:hypothetical protein